eukprot:4516030-Amphidinium_carterae.4
MNGTIKPNLKTWNLKICSTTAERKFKTKRRQLIDAKTVNNDPACNATLMRRSITMPATATNLVQSLTLFVVEVLKDQNASSVAY